MVGGVSCVVVSVRASGRVLLRLKSMAVDQQCPHFVAGAVVGNQTSQDLNQAHGNGSSQKVSETTGTNQTELPQTAETERRSSFRLDFSGVNQICWASHLWPWQLVMQGWRCLSGSSPRLVLLLCPNIWGSQLVASKP